MVENDETELPDWVPAGEPYRGSVDGQTFFVDSENGFTMRVYLELARPLPRPGETHFKDGSPIGVLEPRMEKALRGLAALGVHYVDLGRYDPPCLAAELPLKKSTSVSQTETIARLLLELLFYAQKPTV